MTTEKHRCTPENESSLLFPQERLIEAYLSCRKNKRPKRSSLGYEVSYEHLLPSLISRLRTHTYTPGRSSCFVVTKPKIREIFAADFEDRIIHHLLVKAIEPYYEKRFIYDSYACRKNKGTHKAVERLQEFMTRVTWNQRRNAYYLQLDIRNFFTSIDKNILYSLLCDAIRQRELCNLARIIVKNDPTKNCRIKGDRRLLACIPRQKSLFSSSPQKGLPIGNLTSQFFANVYLNELDQYVKRTLKIKYYIRYVDDMVILSRHRDKLSHWRKSINAFLNERLALELHPDKDKTGSVYQGVDFLGYIVKPGYILCRNRVVHNLKTKLFLFNHGFLSKESMLSTVNSYYGHFGHAHTYRLRRDLYEHHFGMLRTCLEPVVGYTYFKMRKSTEPELYYDLYQLQKYLYLVIQKFPKSYKYSLGSDIIERNWETLDTVMAGNNRPNSEKQEVINDAKVSFEKLILRIRFAHELELISHKQLAHIMTFEEKISKGLANWLRWAKAQQRP